MSRTKLRKAAQKPQKSTAYCPTQAKFVSKKRA